MFIPNQHLNIVHEQMLREAMEQHDPRPKYEPEPVPAKRQRRLLRAPALLMVKLGRSLEDFGLAYLEEQQCSAS
jgi:hypothetical protein